MKDLSGAKNQGLIKNGEDLTSSPIHCCIRRTEAFHTSIVLKNQHFSMRRKLNLASSDLRERRRLILYAETAPGVTGRQSADPINCRALEGKPSPRLRDSRFPVWLRARREWPRDYRAAEKRDEFAAPHVPAPSAQGPQDTTLSI